MTAEQMWEELKVWLVANRDRLRTQEGKFNRMGGMIDRTLEKMQELDPTIANEDIYYNGTEFHPENRGLLPK